MERILFSSFDKAVKKEDESASLDNRKVSFRIKVDESSSFQ